MRKIRLTNREATKEAACLILSAQLGLSIIELMVALAIMGVIAVVTVNVTEFSIEKINERSILSERGSSVAMLGRHIRKNFRSQTRIDPLTGAGLHDAIVFKRATDPHSFLIVGRRRDKVTFSANRYQTVCEDAPVASITYTPPPADFCPGVALLACGNGQRHVIRLTYYSNYSGDTSTATKMQSIPATGSRALDEIYAAALCIHDANADKVRLSLAFGSINKKRQYTWKYENIEAWDDTGRATVEFLAN
jgi:prepilin-type N-terminal cleavage/methylation domain-containing protein